MEVFKISAEESFCRLCFTREGIFRRIQNTAEGLDSTRLIPQLVEKHLHVEIFEESYQVCEECCQQLFSFENFYSKVHGEIDKFLSDFQENVSNIKAEPLEEDPLASSSRDSSLDLNEGNSQNCDDQTTDFFRIVKTEPGVYFPREDISITDTEAERYSSRLSKRSKIKEEPPECSQKYDSDSRRELPTRPIKVEKIPKSIVENGRLIVKGKELKALVNNFYDLECKLCHKKNKYKSLWILFQHYSKVHQQKGYVVCCSKKMKTQNTAIMHMARHLQPDAFKCNVCGYLVARPEFLGNHKKTHLPEEEKPFGCDQCMQRFCWETALKMHKVTYHPKDQRKPFSCHLCERVFIRKDALKEHMSNIHESRAHPKVQCNECGKWLANTKYLKRHKAIHSIRYPSIVESSILP